MGIRADSLFLNIIPIINGIPIKLNKTSQNRWKLMNLYRFRIGQNTIRVITVMAATTITRINGTKIKRRRHKQLRKIVRRTKGNQQVRLTNGQTKLCD